MNSIQRLLCFGDSNTWGYHPEDGRRYPKDIRWSGVLQKLLGESCEVIEEGLNGRTTVFEYQDRVGRHGYDYFIPCFESHSPLDFVVIALGTNDTKAEFEATPKDIANGLEKLIEVTQGGVIEKDLKVPKVLIVAPPAIRGVSGEYAEVFQQANLKIKELPSLYEKLAKKHDCLFLNLYEVIEPSPLDGVHLSKESHQIIADLVYKKILTKA